jgi:DNA-binding HxlR family transcriptional regulator
VQRRYGAGIAYIAIERMEARKLLFDRLELALIPAGYDHCVTALLKLLGQFKADAARATGNQYGSSIQSHGWCLFGSLGLASCNLATKLSKGKKAPKSAIRTGKRVMMRNMAQFSDEQIAAAKFYAAQTPPTDLDPRIEALVNDLIGRVADKWTMMILEVLAEKGELRFTQLSKLVDGISQKMLTQTLRGMERDGLVIRTVHPVVPPKVEYRLTELGITLGAAFCGVWVWAAGNLEHVERARRAFDGGDTTK